MRRVKWYRSTPVRLSLAFSGLIVVTFLAAGAIAYGLIGRQLNTQQDLRIRQIFAELAVFSQKGGATAVAEAVQARLAGIGDKSTILLLRDGAGRVLAGNVGAFPVAPGWSDIAPAAFGVDSDFPYRVHDGPLGELRLTVGLDNADLEEMLEILLGALLWSAVFVIAVAMFAGAGIAARARQRMEAVQSAVGRVAEGDLGARIALSGARDDIDILSVGINAALTRLQASVEAIRQVSTDIAHDLRTPLNRLHMRAEAALVQAGQGQAVAADLEAILGESDAIAATFAALLRIAQIESGSRRERFGPVDLAALLRDVTAIYAEVAEDAGMVLVEGGIAEARITGDKELLTQAVVNVIENAIRHCPSATRITCALEPSSDGIVLHICDNGPGIPPDQREAVLRRLFRLEKSRTTPGSGLGLSLVKAVADLHGASVTLTDAGPGLSVKLAFPMAATGAGTQGRTGDADPSSHRNPTHRVSG